jgi:hypothetical protein
MFLPDSRKANVPCKGWPSATFPRYQFPHLTDFARLGIDSLFGATQHEAAEAFEVSASTAIIDGPLRGQTASRSTSSLVVVYLPLLSTRNGVCIKWKFGYVIPDQPLGTTNNHFTTTIAFYAFDSAVVLFGRQIV